MRYSYTIPRKKTIFTRDLQLLFVFFSVTLFMLFGTYSFLIFKNQRFTQEMVDAKTQKEEYRANIVKMNAEVASSEKKLLLSEKIFTKNSVLRDSINNLFDLVPNRITLSEAKIMENALILHGITPNKDVYNFMLQAPLRSIFHRTYSSFYPAEKGWLRFVSTNYIDNEERLGSEE